MSDLVLALGLALAIEGALYALFPNAMRRFMAELLSQPDDRVRVTALIMVCVGVGLVWAARA